jgi:NADH-quinone oxidoreductase subunit M
MLLAMIAMYWQAGTTDIQALLQHRFPASMQTWLWLAFFASFAVKMPMWPVHTWLPDAHVEAPTAGSVILAGILLKMGGYGFIRFSLPMFPDASLYFQPLVYALSIVAIIYASLVALMQEDMKKLVAYSSVAHMGFVTMGLFSLNAQGIQGAMFQMVSHGLVSGALFLCVGVVYDRIHTRDIAAYGGLVDRMPMYAVAFLVFTMANVGLPGTSSFVGEFLALAGAFRANPWVAFFATTGVILSAAYAHWLYRRACSAEMTKPECATINDLNPPRDRDPRAAPRPRHLLRLPAEAIHDAFAASTDHLSASQGRSRDENGCPAVMRPIDEPAASRRSARPARDHLRPAALSWCWSARSAASARPARHAGALALLAVAAWRVLMPTQRLDPHGRVHRTASPSS